MPPAAAARPSNASRGWLDEGGFERAGIDLILRPDTLAVADFVQLSR